MSHKYQQSPFVRNANCKKRAKTVAPSRRLTCVYYTPGCRCERCEDWRTRSRSKHGIVVQNVFDELIVVGHDEDFVPKPGTPTTAVPGSPEKIAVLRARVEAGEEMFVPGDPWGFEDMRSSWVPWLVPGMRVTRQGR